MTSEFKTRYKLAMAKVDHAATKFQPIREIEWVIAIMHVINGVYLLSPLYRYSQSINGVTPFAAALSHPALTTFYGVVLLVSALILVYGLVKSCPKLRARGLFFIGLSRFYNIATTIMVAGILPLTWLSSLTLVLIIIILWFRERRRVYNAAS